MCFFIVYLLKIITSIIKANTIIVSTTKPNKSKYIISNENEINWNIYIRNQLTDLIVRKFLFILNYIYCKTNKGVLKIFY